MATTFKVGQVIKAHPDLWRRGDRSAVITKIGRTKAHLIYQPSGKTGTWDIGKMARAQEIMSKRTGGQ